MKKPTVTVLMPVYNGEKYLREAIDSILSQTFTDFEFLIINDGSTDKSVEIVESYKDTRIRLVHNKENMKLIATLNRGFELAQGSFIARMDCDDISLPTRLEKQIAFMEANPDVGICGSWIELMGDNAGHVQKYPVGHEDIKAALFFYCALAHPTVILRTSIVKKYTIRYSPEDEHAEDFGLWQRVSHYITLANIPEVLLKYRMWSDSVSSKFSLVQSNTLAKLGRRNLEMLGLDCDDVCVEIFNWFSPKRKREQSVLRRTRHNLERMLEMNTAQKMFNPESFQKAVAKRWFDICYNSTHLGFWLFIECFKPSFRYSMDIITFAKFAVKCTIRYS